MSDEANEKPIGGDGADRGDEVDARPLEQIARVDVESLYERALDSGAVRSFEEDEDAPAYAICPIENGVGDKGWVVLSVTGSSWEGLSYSVHDVYEHRADADDFVRRSIAADRKRYRKRNGLDDA